MTSRALHDRSLVAATIALAAMSGPWSTAQERRPLVRGWISELLHLDNQAARQTYAAALEVSPAENITSAAKHPDRALCHARLCDLAIARGDDSAAATHRAALVAAGIDLSAALAHQAALRKTHSDLQAARSIEDPQRRQAALQALRADLLEFQRTQRARSTVRVVYDQLPRTSQGEEPRAQNRRRPRDRKDRLEVLELYLSGERTRADHLAFFHFSTRREIWVQSRRFPSPEERNAARMLQQLERMADQARSSSRERKTLSQLVDYCKRLIDDGENKQVIWLVSIARGLDLNRSPR